MGADGSLILDTGIDTSGLAAGSKEMLKAIESFGKQATKVITKTVRSVIATIAGVGSALTVLSKSVNSYMSTHWETAAELEACWQAVGEVIGPVIEQVVDLVQQATSYLIDFLYYVGLSSKTAKQASADAKAAAQAMKRSLMGFDELNLLQRDTTKTLGDYELPDWLKEIAELLKGGYFEEAGRTLARQLNEMVDNIDWAALGEKVSYYFKGALMFLYGVIDEFDWNNLGLKIKEFLEAIDWKGIFEAVALNILAAFKGVVEGIWGLLGNTMDDPRIQKFKESYEKLKNSVLTSIDKIGKAVDTLWKKYLKPFIEWLVADALPVVMNLLTAIVETIGNLADVISGEKSLDEFASETKDLFLDLIPDETEGKVKEKVDSLKSKIQEFLSNPVGAITKTNNSIATFLEGFFADNSISDLEGKLVSKIDGYGWGELLESIKRVVSAIPWSEIQQAFADFLFGTIKEAFKLAWQLLGGDEESLQEVLTSLDNLNKKISEVKEKVNEFIQEKVLPYLPTIVDAISSMVDFIGDIISLVSGDISFVDFFSGLDDVQKTFLKILAIFLIFKTAVLGLDLAVKIAKIVEVFGGMATNIGAATAATGEFSTALLTAGESTTTLATLLSGLLPTVLAAFGVAFLNADAKATEEIINNTKEKCEELKETATSDVEAISAQLDLLASKSSERLEAISSGESGKKLADIQYELNTIRDSLTETINAYVDACVASNDATELSAEEINTLKARIDMLVDAYQKSITAKTTVQEAEQASIELQKEINALMEAYGITLNEQGEIVQATADKITDAATSTENLVDSVNEGTKSAGDYKKANENVQKSLTDLGNTTDTAETDVTDYATVVGEETEKTKTDFSEYGTEVMTAIEDIQKELTEGAEDMGDFSGAVDAGATDAEGSIEVMASTIESTMSSLIGEAFEWGYDIGNQIANGLNAAQGAVRSGVRNIASIIRSYLHFSEPDEGPLSDFHTYMPDMIKEMVSGINGGKSSVSTAVSKLADEISNEVNSGDYKIKAVGVELTNGMSGFSNTIINGFENLVSSLQTIAEKVTFKIPEVATGTVVPYATSETINQMDNPTLATLVSSVADLQDMFRRFMGDYSENSNKTMDITLDGMSLARKLYPYNKQVSEEHGRSLIG